MLLLSIISTAGTVTRLGAVEEVREVLLLLEYVFLIIDLGEEGDAVDGNEEEEEEDLADGGADATVPQAEWLEVALVPGVTPVMPVASLCALLMNVEADIWVKKENEESIGQKGTNKERELHYTLYQVY